MLNDNLSMSQPYSGTSIADLNKGQGPWNFYIPPITASKYHSVLYELPYNPALIPQPHVRHEPKQWDEDHVKMPFSIHNLFPAKDDEHTKTLKPRWEIICDVLTRPIKRVSELEEAINSYNSSLPKFLALEYFFEEVFTEDESFHFFENLLPKIINLALRLPEILPGNLPLLKKNQNRSVSLSQLQVSSLLANAFLCTFPWRKEVAAQYPGVNFVRLYSAHQRPKRINCIVEKLKSIIHYFRKITNEDPKGVITFERIFIPRSKIPRWDVLENNLGNTRVHIQCSGTIEDDGMGFLQVDFANKNVGGGVLGYGCVQEEIRFVICPELLITRLFVEQLADTEAVIVRGVQRFSKYTGYGDTFEWNGDYEDNTPCDKYGRRLTTIAIIDATKFFKVEQQYYPNAILRELSKAYVGFYSHHTENLAPVATGNWGCGAFGGDTKLKTLIQLMACNAAHRDLVYYTFGNKELQESFYNMYLFLAANRVTICELWRIFCRFAVTKLPPSQFYSFIQQSLFDNANKPAVLRADISPRKNNQINNSPLKNRSSEEKVENTVEGFKLRNINKAESSEGKSNSVKEVELVSESDSSSEDIIPSSQPDIDYLIPVKKSKEKISFNKKLFEENHKDILDIYNKIDGPSIPKKTDGDDIDQLLSEKLKRSKRESVESGPSADKEDTVVYVDESSEEAAVVVKSRSKITDYFSKWGKS